MSAPFERRWLTITEASAYIGVHPKSLYQMIAAKTLAASRLPATKRGGRGAWRLDKLRLDTLLEAGSATTAEAPLDRRRRG